MGRTGAPQHSIVVVVRSLTMGGVQHQASQIAQQLATRGWRVTIAALDDGPLRHELELAGIKTVLLHRPALGRHVGGYVALQALIQQIQPGYVYGLAVLPSAFVALGSLSARTRSPVRVVGVRATDLEASVARRRYRLLASFPRRIGRRHLGLISNSETALRAALDQGFSRDQVRVVPNGIDARVFAPATEADKVLARRQFGLPESALVVGNVTRVGGKKGLLDLIAAVPRIAAIHANLKVAIAGVGADDPYVSSVVDSAGVCQFVHFLGTVEDMPRFYHSMDLYVSASRYGEGFPNAIGEALASGLNVVVTDTGDSGLIAPDYTVCVPPCSPTLLADAALAALESVRCPGDIHDFMVENYSVADLGSRTEAALADLARWRSAGSPR